MTPTTVMRDRAHYTPLRLLTRPKSASSNPVVDSDLVISRASKEPALFAPLAATFSVPPGLATWPAVLDILLLLSVKIGVTRKDWRSCPGGRSQPSEIPVATAYREDRDRCGNAGL